ncbi:hypothetical protein LN149_003644 [Providencia stuartii]
MTSTLLAVALTLGSAQAAEYKASDKEGPIKIVNLDELESQVAKNMEKALLATSVVVRKGLILSSSN